MAVLYTILVLVNNYEALLSSTEILSPPEVLTIADEIRVEQQPIVDRRKALFDHVQGWFAVLFMG